MTDMIRMLRRAAVVALTWGLIQLGLGHWNSKHYEAALGSASEAWETCVYHHRHDWEGACKFKEETVDRQLTRRNAAFKTRGSGAGWTLGSVIALLVIGRRQREALSPPIN
jgi:hypothetical protein